MPTPPNFSGTSHEEMQRLLQRGKAWEDTKAGWKMTGHFGLIVAAVVVVVIAVGVLAIQVISRLH